MKAETLKKVLGITYDLVEVLRALRVQHNILHRDISPYNVRFLKAKNIRKLQGVTGHQTKDLCFIKHLLDSKNHPRRSSLLLIDFDKVQGLYGAQDDGGKEANLATSIPNW
ncbi:hypothetical protein FA13DRAFT_1814227 [Coprinellus micaceus]|uniref:Fungal-type protein kinase domain-containing protein n=1 Tax=Coprinellus micaceus TaxID=71717 RepID=A0A4Y7T9Y5_COPMI|nr:hypothetical protein FA13DRAFT_1814227 [Coprinellus micaceus]